MCIRNSGFYVNESIKSYIRVKSDSRIYCRYCLALPQCGRAVLTPDAGHVSQIINTWMKKKKLFFIFFCNGKKKRSNFPGQRLAMLF